jgi:hypothetical protein
MDLVVEKGIPGTFRFQPSFRTNFFEKDFFLTIVPVRIRFLRNKPTATILDAILQRVKLHCRASLFERCSLCPSLPHTPLHFAILLWLWSFVAAAVSELVCCDSNLSGEICQERRVLLHAS